MRRGSAYPSKRVDRGGVSMEINRQEEGHLSRLPAGRLELQPHFAIPR